MTVTSVNPGAERLLPRKESVKGWICRVRMAGSPRDET